VEVEGSLLKWWVGLYALARVWRKGEREKYMRFLARLASPGQVGHGVTMGVGARRAHEWSAEIRPKASHVHDFLLSFIIAMSPCLISLDRDRPSRLRGTVALGGCSL
jgi:hypothetical protein